MPISQNVYLHGNLIKHYITSGSISISSLSERTGRSIPFVTKIVNELVADGILKDDGVGLSNGGRRPARHSLVKDILYTLSVAVNQFTTRVAIVDISDHSIINEKEFALDLYHDIKTAQKLASIIKNFITQPDIDISKFLGAQVTMPGFVDTTLGINKSFLKAPQGTLVEYLSDQIGLPVFIDNDSAAIALAEQVFGDKGAGKNSMIVNLGWGVGLGMIINGQIFKGHSGFAGEFSHLALFKNGQACHCGKFGCLETEASLEAVVRKAKEGISAGSTTHLSIYEDFGADEIIKEAVKGDAFCVKIISDAAYSLGQGIAILIHLMNPETIILSGKGSVLGKIWMAPIQQALNEHCIPQLTTYVNVLVSKIGTNAQFLGGVALMAENLQYITRSPDEEQAAKAEKELVFNSAR